MSLRLPAEHGAWGLLAVPFLTAASVAAPPSRENLPLLLCAVCALALFLLRGSADSSRAFPEPAAGGRGSGWRTLLEPAHVALALTAAVSGGALLLVYGRYQLLPVGGAALLLYLAQRELVRRHARARAEKYVGASSGWPCEKATEKRSLPAELAGVLLLSLGAPAAGIAARGMLERAVMELWALNLVFFAGGVLYVKYRVRGVHSHRQFAGMGERLAFAWPVLVYHALLAAFLPATILRGAFPALVLLAFAPGILRALALAAQLGERFPIRRLGWTEMLHAVVFAALLILAYGAG